MRHHIRAVLFHLDDATSPADRFGKASAIGAFASALKREGATTAACAHGTAATGAARAAGLDLLAGEHGEASVFLRAAKRLRVPAFHCLVVASRNEDAAAAKAAGMKCIGVGAAGAIGDAPEVVASLDEIDVEALLDTGRPRRFVAEPWGIAATDIAPARAQYWETLFAVTNGYLGVRGNVEEEDERLDSHRGTFVNRFVGYEDYHHIWEFPGFARRLHAMLNVCDWTIVNLTVGGERFSLAAGGVSDHVQRLDLEHGVLERSFTWTTKAGARVRVATKRLASMTRRRSALITYELTAETDAEVALESAVRFDAPSLALPGEQIDVASHESSGERDTVVLKATTGTDEAAAAFSHRWATPGGFRTDEPVMDDMRLSRSCGASLTAGQTLSLAKHAAFVTTLDVDAGELARRANEDVAAASDAGAQALVDEQACFWRRYWERADIRIEGDVRDQQAVRFALFHLRQGHPEDDRRSISANGMTGDKYCGHVFWDTEMYMLPQFLYTEPEVVKPLLMYRHHLLPRARERARQLDGDGALYSWNSITGEECCVVFEAATAEYHLECAIARGIHRYVEATGDEAFLYDFGAEMLFETARFLSTLGGFVPHKGDRFCINIVCGPDEYGCGVNNNCYTNAMARWHFTYAADVYEKMERDAPDTFAELTNRIGLTREHVDRWRDAAERMYIPFDDELGIHAQDDSFLSLEPVDMDLIPKNTDVRELMHPLNLWRLQVIKQADIVLLMFVLGHEFDAAVKKANYEFYEPRTSHGSSLSASVHSVVASEIGEREAAYDYFRQSAMMDLNDFKNNTAGGVHSASLGGTWMAIVNGFAGMRDYPDGLRFDPHVPAGWDAYEFRLVYRGRRIHVRVIRTAATYTLEDGDAVEFTSSATPVRLAPDAPTVTVC